jgi:hypothetical protein
MADLVDMNTVIKVISQNKDNSLQSQIADDVFIKRLFVISNKGI